MVIQGSFSPVLHKNICCEYSLEVPQQGTSNEYPQSIQCIFMEKSENLSQNYH